MANTNVTITSQENVVTVSRSDTAITVASVGAQGATGATGAQGPSGVIAVNAPITNSGTSTSAVVGIDQSALTIAESQVTNLTSDLALKAPIASPTFTGTVSGITKSMVGLSNVDDTSDANKPVSTAQQTALNLKAPLASPTFTGIVTIPASSVVTGLMTVTPSASGVIGLIVQGVASQSVDLQEWKNSSGTILTNINSTGGIETTGGMRFYASTSRASWSTLTNTSGNLSFNYQFALTDRFSVTAGAAGTIAAIVKGAAAQTANLQEWQNSSATVLLAVSSAGMLKYAAANTGTTVGAAGGGSALPATPTGYLQVDIGGTTYKVPYFAN